MEKINQEIAKKIIETLGSYGTPPEIGVKYFTVGLNEYLNTIEEEYLNKFIKNGGSSFKMIVGSYGWGKTHFLYCIRDIAWEKNFVVSYVSLSPSECPFHKVELVYKAIVKGLLPPVPAEELISGFPRGIESLIRSWFGLKYSEFQKLTNNDGQFSELMNGYINELMMEIENTSFKNAVKNAFKSLLDKKEEDFSSICQWLKGEGYDSRIHRKYGIFHKIDKTNAFELIRSLVQWIRTINYSGLVILFDEAERISSISTKNKEQHLTNLREIIDECGQNRFRNVIIFYAVPDENFLVGRTIIYEALNQRLRTFFSINNPNGVKILLDKIVDNPQISLEQLGEKLTNVFEIAYNVNLDKSIVKETIKEVAEIIYRERFGDIGFKRSFVQNIVAAFHFINNFRRKPSMEDIGLT